MKTLAHDEEKQCSRCGDYWPADLEFFHSKPQSKDGLNSWCKACYNEWRLASRNRLPSPEGRHSDITAGIAPLLTTAHFMGRAL